MPPTRSIRIRTSRKARLLAATCCCALSARPLRVESFSLVQSTAAAREDSAKEERGVSGRGSAGRAAAASSAEPFRSGRRERKRVWINDDFALRMSRTDEMESFDAAPRREVSMSMMSTDLSVSTCEADCEPVATSSTETFNNNAAVIQRRKFLHKFVASTAALATSTAPAEQSTAPSEASAFEYTYPVELTSASPVSVDSINAEENSSNSLSKLQQERLTNKRTKVLATQKELSSDPLGLSTLSTPQEGILLVTGVSLWALALWFLSGSRSNPLINPIANVLYSEHDSQWLRDRNEGYFAEYPPQLTIVLAMIFVFLGMIADRSIYFLADGDADVPLQLGGVAVLSGGFWEVGRLATGEKGGTRAEIERDDLIEKEFAEFAERRLLTGKSTLSAHRSEIVKAFRRFNPKYRVQNDEYPLSDIEIERVVRKWARERGVEMSSAGFFSGVGIDSAADAFAPR